MNGIPVEDENFIARFLSKVDTSYIQPHNTVFAFKQIIRAIKFLGFFNDHSHLVTVDKKTGKPRNYLDVFGDVLANKLSMNDDDRDLVVMRHNFVIED